MKPPRRQEEDCWFDCGLRLIGGEEVVSIETWIACEEGVTGVHAPIRAALRSLESLPPEACPEKLAERTVQLLCAVAREAAMTERTKTTRRRSLHREDLSLCQSSNILVK